MLRKYRLLGLFKNPIKVVLAFFLLVLFLLPLTVAIGQIIYSGDALRANKNTTSQTFFPPGEALNGGCMVTNTSFNTDFFVPFKSINEWNAFKNNKPSSISINCQGNNCSNSTPYCTWKHNQPQACQQRWTCTIYNFGFYPGNCTFIPEMSNEVLGYFQPDMCCQTMAPDGCMNDLPYCYSDGSYCSSEPDMNYCGIATNQNQCTGGTRGQYCNFYQADTLCQTDYGNVCYDPDFQYCCSPGHVSFPLVCDWISEDGGPSVYNRCDYAPPPWFAECVYAQ